MILAVDTTHEFGSLALVEPDHVVEEVLVHSPGGHSQVLFDQLERLLERHEITVQEMECFAVASGPGSFTGVRVGLAAVKGLAEAAAKQVVAVSNLEAIAFFGTARLRAVVIDARRGDVYAAVFDDALSVVLPERVTKFSSWLDTLPEGDLEFLSTDFAPFASALVGTWFESAPVRTVPRALAGAIGRIAYQRPRLDSAIIRANYVRRSDAELFWKDQA